MYANLVFILSYFCMRKTRFFLNNLFATCYPLKLMQKKNVECINQVARARWSKHALDGSDIKK